MREAHPEFSARSVGIVAVAAREPWQLAQLVADGYPFPLLLDPDDGMRRQLGVERLDRRAAWDLRALPTYVRAWWGARQRGERHRAVWSEADKAPATFIIDAEWRVTWRYVGQRIGDYPTVDDLRDALS